MVAQQANFVQESVDRVREAVASIEDDIDRVQRRMQKEWKTRRKSMERQVTSHRKDFEKKTQRQMKRLRTELLKNPYVRRAQEAVDDATKQFEQGVDNVLKVLHVASQRDLNRIDRKLNQINKKLRELEKSKQGNGAAEAS
jgi:hypothetical protein